MLYLLEIVFNFLSDVDNIFNVVADDFIYLGLYGKTKLIFEISAQFRMMNQVNNFVSRYVRDIFEVL